MIGDDRLPQCQAAVIGGNLPVEVDSKPILFQTTADEIEQDTVLPHAAG